MSGSDRRTFILASAAMAVLPALGFSRIAQAQDAQNLFIQFVPCRIKAGQDEAAVALFSELAEAHRLNSPECLAFHAQRSLMDPQLFSTYEVFTSKEAALQTSQADHMRAFFPRYGQVYDGFPERQEFTQIAGFAR